MNWVELTKEAISNILEKMFYTIIEFESSGDSSDWENAKKITSHIKLSGKEGSVIIIITISEPSAFQLAADFTGVVVEKVKMADVEDCLKELANMVGGYCINVVKGQYSLGLPEIGYPPEVDVPDKCASFPMFVLGEKWGEVAICTL
ncbi:MAG: chemotaxis protein CheX [Thermodesulforhabdaceae bacterium]|jgi:CheY-specific phosphatase CheX